MRGGVWLSNDTRNDGAMEPQPAWWVDGDKLWWLTSQLDFELLRNNYPFKRDYEVDRIELLLPQEFME